VIHGAWRIVGRRHVVDARAVWMLFVAPLVAAILLPGCRPEAREVTMLSTTSVSGDPIQPNTLISVDRSSGSQSTVGEPGLTPEQSALAWDPVTGALFGVNPWSSPGVLTRIDLSDGRATTAATFPQSVKGIAFSPSGELYVLVSRRTLGVADIAHATFTEIGDIAGGDFIVGLDFSADGILYAVTVQQNPFAQVIVSVDPATAEVKSTVSTGDASVGDITWAPDGFLYATNFSWALFRLAPEDGTQTLVGFGELGALGGLAVVY
jgi:hypothetical protein